MQTAGVKIFLPAGKAHFHNDEVLYCGVTCSENDSIAVNYKIELDAMPEMLRRIDSAIKLIESPFSELNGGAAELASMEAELLDLAQALQAYRDAIIRKNSLQRIKDV